MLNNSQLPSLAKKRLVLNPGSYSAAEDNLIKDRLNKQHNKVEQEIKKYDEILKRNKNIRQENDYKKKNNRYHYGNENLHNQSNVHHHKSMIEERPEVGVRGMELIKINGVKLDNRNLDARRGARPHNDSSIILEPKPAQSKLPSLNKMGSEPKGLIGKYNRLR